jgi:hypothetical protein
MFLYFWTVRFFVTVQEPSIEEKKSVEERFFDQIREKIEKQIQDIDQINIMTGVSSNLTGEADPAAESLVSFIEAKTKDVIKGKVIDSARLGDYLKPIEAPDIVKTSGDLNATVLLRTIIELDGDICLLFRGQQIDSSGKQAISLDSGLLAAHQANVSIAVENWHYLVNTALDSLKLIRDFVKT